MRTNKLFVIIICVAQTACQFVATPVVISSPTKTNPTPTLLPTQTPQPTAAITLTITPPLNPNLGYWNGLQYDTRKWMILTYNDKEWTPQTYPTYTLEPVLTHKFIENCMIYLEEGRDMPGLIIREVPVIIGGHIIFDERIFQDGNGQELFMVILGSYHVDFPRNEDKSQCIKDAERVAMTGMRGGCSSGNCGYCPGLPRTNLKIEDMVKLVNPQMSLPVTEPGGHEIVGRKNDWYFDEKDFTMEELQQWKDFNIQVIDGPVCAGDNAWWQLRNPTGIIGWDSDDHFIIQP